MTRIRAKSVLLVRLLIFVTQKSSVPKFLPEYSLCHTMPLLRVPGGWGLILSVRPELNNMYAFAVSFFTVPERYSILVQIPK